jgi:hypothetical protein
VASSILRIETSRIGVRDRDLKRIITGNIRKYLLEKDERSVICNFAEMIEEEEPTTKELLHYSRTISFSQVWQRSSSEHRRGY